MGRVLAFVFAAMLVGWSGLLLHVARKAYFGTLAYGSRAGLRTPATLHSEAAWKAGQRATVWFLRGWAAGAIAVAVLCAAAGGVVADADFALATTWLGAIALSLAYLASVPIMMHLANRAAQATLTPPSPGHAAG